MTTVPIIFTSRTPVSPRRTDTRRTRPCPAGSGVRAGATESESRNRTSVVPAGKNIRRVFSFPEMKLRYREQFPELRPRSIKREEGHGASPGPSLLT